MKKKKVADITNHFKCLTKKDWNKIEKAIKKAGNNAFDGKGFNAVKMINEVLEKVKEKEQEKAFAKGFIMGRILERVETAYNQVKSFENELSDSMRGYI